MNLLDLLKGQLTSGNTMDVISNLLGENKTATKSGLDAILPTLLGSVIQKGATTSGASGLMDMIKLGGHDGSVLDNIGGMLGGGDKTTRFLNSGSGILTSLLGDKLGGVASLIGGLSGLKSGSTSSLLQMAAPLVMGMIGKHSAGQSTSGLMSMLAGGAVLAQPAEVVIGTYVNKVQDLSFRENHYAVDFYIWFRWKAKGTLAEYKPLDSFEILNGRVDSKTSVVEKKIGDMNYASARIAATINENWELASFPFDWHRTQVRIEDSQFTALDLKFVADKTNSRLGDEIDMAGWRASNFGTDVQRRHYRTNYGDTSLPSDAQSEYSRYVVSWDIDRVGWGAAVKLLSTVILATGVAFVSFMVKPSDLDARFGMGVGALFAVAASAFVVSASVPDSASLTIADKMHMVALGFIFLTLLLSALCLRLEVHEREELAFRIDHWCLAVMPLLFYGWVGWAIFAAARMQIVAR